MNEKIIQKLLTLSEEAKNKNEVPVSAIIEKNDKIISYAYNKREKNNDILGHAEIICIKKASKKLKTWKLNGCNLYTNLKPCSMCLEIIKQSRIKNVYYILDKPKSKKEFNEIKLIKYNNLQIEKRFQKNLSDFFINKR